MLETEFSTQIPEASFVHQTYTALRQCGFTPSNTIPCVTLCRDELTVPFLNLINKAWSSGHNDCQAFIMHSLGGLLLLGKTGMKAATSHAPQGEDGKTRYVFYSFTHIGLNDHGVHGMVKRHGLKHESTACGALVAFRNELLSGSIDVGIDPNDIEQSILKQRLIKNIKLNQQVPTLAELTKIAHTTTLHDLEHLISLTINSENGENLSDYAVFTGVQIHHGKHINSIWPSTSYVVAGGVRTDFGLEHWVVNDAVGGSDVEE